MELYMGDEISEINLLCWYHTWCKGRKLIITKLCILLILLRTCQHMVGLVRSKTSYCQYEQTPINILFQRWMILKIVNLAIFMIIFHTWKKFVKLLGLMFCLVNFPMIIFTLFMYIVNLFLTFLITGIDL